MIPERQYRTPLFDALVSLAESRKISFHTPGHKSGKGISTRFRKFVGPKIFTIDLTTLDEVDCLQRPVGVIKEAQELAAEAYGADHSFFLINGTTVGNHAMILSTASPGDEILVARNAHKSILTGVILSGATPRFFPPVFDEGLGILLNVTGEQARDAMERHPNAKLLALTSPNYYGVAADLRAIVSEAKRRGILVLVDEAHGPHFHFHRSLPPSALDAGADICVQSTHKILGGMTQSSMLHLKGPDIEYPRVVRLLHLLQSTSPSYILMASLDLARMQMATEGEKLLGKAVDLAKDARDRVNRIPGLFCFGEAHLPEGAFTLDVTKLTICVKELGLSGFEASAILNAEFGIQVEMADLFNILVIVSIGDRKDDLDRLVGALHNLAGRAARPTNQRSIVSAKPPMGHRFHLPPRDAFFAPSEHLPLAKAEGRISSDIVTIYPPGIPVLVPGEEVGASTIHYLLSLASHGARIDGVLELDEPRIRVLCD
ncbi:MAG: aminotransferase class I/II-fold pyridoxal phosphate-dependent enzyme [Candidatus Methylomirabilis oxyfera]|nr:aminotransferase class I/II-fold pyridoxal phosphate-dependent enzyme [Candidatus Methylomirabilis oxyfera]